MSTRREQIIQHIVAAVTAANIGVVKLTRNRTAPFAREECPAINLDAVSDQPQRTVVPKLDWSLSLMFTLIMRSATPETSADSIIQKLHAAVMADQTQGGMAIDTQPGSVDWKFSDADAGACDILLEFKIQYRTSQSDLTIS